MGVTTKETKYYSAANWPMTTNAMTAGWGTSATAVRHLIANLEKAMMHQLQLFDRGGVIYGRGVRGKYQFRVRELHIAKTYVPLMKAKKVGAVKLDLLLRGIALLPPGMPAGAKWGWCYLV